jgi:hypothetical protein
MREIVLKAVQDQMLKREENQTLMKLLQEVAQQETPKRLIVQKTISLAKNHGQHARGFYLKSTLKYNF